MNPANTEHEHWMALALEQAELAREADEVPVGAIVVRNGELIGRGYNQPVSACDPSAHAEIIALRDAAITVSNYRLPGATIYVTVEPCTMCFGAMVHARVARIVYGASEPRAGVIGSQLALASEDFYNHRIETEGGVLADQCGGLIASFFRDRR